MGVVKQKKNKTKNNDDDKNKNVPNGKTKEKNDKGKVKKKKTVSCLQCIKPVKDGGLEGKYRVAAPELMQDTFMSDSEDEGGEVECPIQQQQQYRYMNSEAGTLHRPRPLEDSVTDGHLWPSNNDKKVATMERQPVDIGFLVSFVVDARGGAMKAKRRGGVRIIVPPAACAAPTRVTCRDFRAATRRAPAAAPPPLMEGEALASRLLELQPQGAKFLAPVIIEVPIFTSPCREREIVILRSETGETWQDHYLQNNDNPMIQEALQRERLEYGNTGETLGENGERVTRIVTCDFPHYLACVSRVRQEVHIIGPEGGAVSSAHIPQVQALFPPAALTKRIRVGLQAHGASPALTRRILPRHAAVSPVLTVEPRRRKFHRTITLTAPLPVPQGGTHEKPSTSNLRLLCSIMGGQARAVWEDVTGSTPLTITDDCASFTTTVSARFWLMNCQNVSDASKLATELYRDMLLVPFEVRIVVLGKRLDALEGRLLLMYITDRYAYDTLLQQEHYTEVAHSTSVRFLDTKEVYLEFSGNLVPVTKSGSQPMFTFEAFKDNRVEFTVRVKHHEESPSGRIYFMNEPKVPKGEQSQTPACVLDVELPSSIAPRAHKSHADYLNLDQSGFDALKDELSFHWGDHNTSLGPASLPDHHEQQLNGHAKIITNGDVKYPTQDTDTDIKDTKPQVNGDSLHADSNKAKATFDSDEDKTPMNTLEKGKKKAEGGSFLGGLADKVKNVFSHSEDKEDEVRESSPKPQPKPRESKEKSPPKPAPRLINEDLLDKVEDMFKDLHQKPPQKDEEDLESQVYNTKLVVDEETPASGAHTKEELYEQYALMQPVDTPVVSKKSDPFAFYYDCCDGKFKGQKHRHDETSNLLDIVEQDKFFKEEKQVASDAINQGISGTLDDLNKEKDKITEKTSEVAEDLFVKCDTVKGDIKNKGQELKSNAEGKLADLEKLANDQLDNAKDTAHGLQTNIQDGIENTKSAAEDSAKQVAATSGQIKEDLRNVVNEFDFAAREKAEELKNRGHEKVVQFEESVANTADNIKQKSQEISTNLNNKAHDGANALAESAADVQNNLSHKAEDLKTDVKDAANNVKEATNETVQSAKEKSKNAKKEAKKKAKEGKNFFTGLVHNIFGEKEKLEDEIKGKVEEGKESANELLDQASAKKDEIKEGVAKKQEELKEGADSLVQNVQTKTQEVEQAVYDKKNEIEKSVQGKANEAKQAAENKAEAIKTAVHDKSSEVRDSIQNKTNEIKDAAGEIKYSIQDTASEAKDAIQTKTSEVKDAVYDTASEVQGAIQDKANEAKSAIQDKTNEIKGAVESKTIEIKQSVNDKANQLRDSVERTTSDVKDAVSNKTNEVKDAIHDKASEATNAFYDKTEELGSAVQSKKDELGVAFQTKKDAVQNAAQSEMDRIRQEAEQTTDEIKRAAEETLNAAADKRAEYQSSIANKYDDLQQAGSEHIHDMQQSASDTLNDIQRSSKQAFGHAQESTLSTFDNLESSAKDKVSDVKDTWEDLQSSTRDTYADMKDDMHSLGSSAQDTLHSFQSSAGNTFDSLDDSAREIFGGVQTSADSAEVEAKELFGNAKESFEGFQVSADNKLEEIKGSTKERLEEASARLGEVQEGVAEGARSAGDTVASEADKFTNSLNNLGSSVFGSSGKGLMKDSSTKLLESEKAQHSPHKKSSGFFSKLRRNP